MQTLHHLNIIVCTTEYTEVGLLHFFFFFLTTKTYQDHSSESRFNQNSNANLLSIKLPGYNPVCEEEEEEDTEITS